MPDTPPPTIRRWVITHRQNGYRGLTLGCQARWTFATKADAEDRLEAMFKDNATYRLRSIYGTEFHASARVQEVACWENGDPCAAVYPDDPQ